MQSLGIIAISVAAAIFYGIVHDQITARVCVEYFTIGHPRMIDSESPTVLGVFWGIVATWWVGLPLGIGLAGAARAGKKPKLNVWDVVRPIIKLLCFMFIVAAITGFVGFEIAKAGYIRLLEPLASQVPAEKHIAFLADGCAHIASYASGIIGGIVLWVSTWRRRSRFAEDRAFVR